MHRFSRSELRESALAYMRGLIAPLQRENGWTVAEQAGRDGPDRIQRMLNRIDWNADEVLNDVREYVVENLADHRAVLMVGDIGFLKKGTGTGGVQRRYSGMAARTENCQIGVFLAYATERGRTLIDRRLYLPPSWTDDRAVSPGRHRGRDRFQDEGGHGQGDGPQSHRGQDPVRLGDRGCRLRLQQGLAVRADGRLPRHGHHPARDRGHPLGTRPPCP
ncbi:hypothetical protein DWB77_00378 [Streptomyces hundungensis]|uniref:Transposase IS701-like DDE domain-containing protein n=1 Tax=Streptomyces hundungensis TaxID=1077946 RepID=A0A387H6S3_9ACTN|nr:hypothetical protein DWB77_00378 [Streptomyces hundungensis]